MATDRSAMSIAPPNQKPQKPARRANHAPTAAALSRVNAANATCIAMGWAIHGGACMGGSLPKNRSRTSTPTLSAPPSRTLTERAEESIRGLAEAQVSLAHQQHGGCQQ